jgi:hypothetical protein
MAVANPMPAKSQVTSSSTGRSSTAAQISASWAAFAQSTVEAYSVTGIGRLVPDLAADANLAARLGESATVSVSEEGSHGTVR